MMVIRRRPSGRPIRRRMEVGRGCQRLGKMPDLLYKFISDWFREGKTADDLWALGISHMQEQMAKDKGRRLRRGFWCARTEFREANDDKIAHLIKISPIPPSLRSKLTEIGRHLPIPPQQDQIAPDWRHDDDPKS